MTRYVCTISEHNGHRMYGIDLVSYEDGDYTVLMSRPGLTDDWRHIYKIARYANILGVPPNLFDEFLDVMRG